MDYKVNATQAEIVRGIFQKYVDGWGLKRASLGDSAHWAVQPLTVPHAWIVTDAEPKLHDCVVHKPVLPHSALVLHNCAGRMPVHGAAWHAVFVDVSDELTTTQQTLPPSPQSADETHASETDAPPPSPPPSPPPDPDAR